MASFEEDRAAMAMAHDKIMQSIAPLQQAHSLLEEGRGQLTGVTGDSIQAAVHETNAMISRAMEDIVSVRQTVSAAVQTSEGVATNL